MPKIGTAGTVHVSIVRRLRPDGSRYVQEVRSVYDPKIKNNKVLSSKTLGILPAGETDLSKLQPVPRKRKSSMNEQPASSGRPEAIREIAGKMEDSRVSYLVIYPLDLVLLVILLAGLAGYTSDYQISEYWKVHRAFFKMWFDDFPDRDISHDTVRRIIKLIGKDQSQKLISRFTDPLVSSFARRIVNVDGQALRAAISQEHQDHSRYILNLYDSDNEVCLQQILIEEKHNEITEAINIIKDQNLTGALLTCDAMNTQKELARVLIEEKHCDYCFALKRNHKHLHELVCGCFEARSAAPIVKHAEAKDLGHGREEVREISVLPASVLNEHFSDELAEWAGLEHGCLVKARTIRRGSKRSGQDSDETRYFISSLHFDETYIAQTLARVIRRHWCIENNLHWVLDVTYGQDRKQCRNADYLTGRTALNKVIFNLTSKAQCLIEKETGKDAPTKSVMKVRFSSPESTLKLLADVLAAARQTESGQP